jgi:hypothetical protein
MVFSFARILSAGPCNQQPQVRAAWVSAEDKNIWEAAAIIPRRARFGHTKMAAGRAETGEPIGGY